MDIAAAFKCNDEHPPEAAHLDEQPEAFYVSEIIEDMCEGHFAVGRTMRVAGPNYLHNSGLWIPFYTAVCAP